MDLLFQVICEHDAAGTFQVVELRHQDGGDYTFLVRNDERFLSLADLAGTIAQRLGVARAEVEVEEV